MHNVNSFFHVKHRLSRLSNKTIFFLSLSLAFTFIFITNFFAWAKSYSVNAQNNIAKEVIRFHVLANSDSEFDQNLKLKVRDKVINYLQKDLKNSLCKNETKIVLTEKLDAIKEIAENVIRQNGFSYYVKAYLTEDFFPTKRYADIKLPAGKYETLKIIIGEGKGHNWWCVMFPPLCFVDATKKAVPDNLKNEFRNVLSQDEFDLINCTHQRLPVKIKFKIVEVCQQLANKNKVVHAAKIKKGVA